MFTGIVEEIGRVVGLRSRSSYRRITIGAHTILGDVEIGDSIAVDGACQTIVRIGDDEFDVETLAVSLEKTTLGTWSVGRTVNLERALTPTSRLGGHFVQGHVDDTARIADIRRDGENGYLSVDLPPELARYCVCEGSITIDGVSLTVAALSGRRLTVNVIPHTWHRTTLGTRRVGDSVNLEVDILGRYVERLMSPAAGRRPLSAEHLVEWGYA